jgi:hypothetical protein
MPTHTGSTLKQVMGQVDISHNATKLIHSTSYEHLKDGDYNLCCRDQYQSTFGHNNANSTLLDQFR